MKRILLVLFVLFVPAIAYPEEPSNKDTQNPVCLIKTSMGNITVELFPEEAPETVQNFIDLAEGRKEFTEIKKNADSSTTSQPTVALMKVKRPFYDGLNFHRVIKGFMIQGGCPWGNGKGGPGYKFEDEINADALGLDKIKAIKGKRTHPYLGIRSQREFEQEIIFPLTRKMGAKTLKEHRALWGEALKKLPDLTLKDCYENQGYRYNPSLKSRHLVKGVLAMANSGPNTNGSQFFICLVDTPWLEGKHTAFGKVIEGFEVVENIGNVEVDKTKKPLEEVKIISIRLEER